MAVDGAAATAVAEHVDESPCWTQVDLPELFGDVHRYVAAHVPDEAVVRFPDDPCIPVLFGCTPDKKKLPKLKRPEGEPDPDRWSTSTSFDVEVGSAPRVGRTREDAPLCLLVPVKAPTLVALFAQWYGDPEVNTTGLHALLDGAEVYEPMLVLCELKEGHPVVELTEWPAFEITSRDVLPLPLLRQSVSHYRPNRVGDCYRGRSYTQMGKWMDNKEWGDGPWNDTAKTVEERLEAWNVESKRRWSEYDDPDSWRPELRVPPPETAAMMLRDTLPDGSPRALRVVAEELKLPPTFADDFHDGLFTLNVGMATSGGWVSFGSTDKDVHGRRHPSGIYEDRRFVRVLPAVLLRTGRAGFITNILRKVSGSYCGEWLESWDSELIFWARADDAEAFIELQMFLGQHAFRRGGHLPPRPRFDHKATLTVFARTEVERIAAEKRAKLVRKHAGTAAALQKTSGHACNVEALVDWLLEQPVAVGDADATARARAVDDS